MLSPLLIVCLDNVGVLGVIYPWGSSLVYVSVPSVYVEPELFCIVKVKVAVMVGVIKDVCPRCGRHENEGVEMEKISCLDCYDSCGSLTK